MVPTYDGTSRCFLSASITCPRQEGFLTYPLAGSCLPSEGVPSLASPLPLHCVPTGSRLHAHTAVHFVGSLVSQLPPQDPKPHLRRTLTSDQSEVAGAGLGDEGRGHVASFHPVQCHGIQVGGVHVLVIVPAETIEGYQEQLVPGGLLADRSP